PWVRAVKRHVLRAARRRGVRRRRRHGVRASRATWPSHPGAPVPHAPLGSELRALLGTAPTRMTSGARHDAFDSPCHCSAPGTLARLHERRGVPLGRSIMRLCYYGELDPFTGIAGDVRAGAAVIAELSLLCLLYDGVIVPPGNLLEHPLALPAF